MMMHQQPSSQQQSYEAHAPSEPQTVSQGAIGQQQPTNNQQVELDHSIGYSGKIVDSVHLHPSLKDFILVAASSIVVRDLQDPHNQHFLTAHDDQITCMALSYNGNYLASGQRGENADVVIWDFHQKKAIYRLSEHDNEVTLLAFSYDDKLLLSCGNSLDGKLFIWNIANGHIVSSLNIIPSVFSEAPRCLVWGGFAKDYKQRNTTDYQFAIAGTNKMTMWQLNPFNGQATSDLINTGTLKRDYTCLTYSKSNEDYLFAGTNSGDLCSFQVKTKGLAFTVNACAMGIKTIRAVSVDRIVVGGGDGQIILFNTNGVTVQAILKQQLYGSIHGLSVSSDGLQLLTASDRGFIYRVRCNDFSQMLLCENHTAPVLSVWFMKDVSDKFITCSEDGTIRLWDSNNYSVTARCIAPSGNQATLYPNCAVFTDEVILSGWSDGKIRAFRLDNCQLLWQIDNAHKNGVTAIELASNCKFLCSGGTEGDIRVWEIRSRELISHLKEHNSRVTNIKLFPDDTHLLSCARDKSILCWDLKAEKRVSAQSQRMGGINCFAMSPLDNNKYISVGQERKITYWDLKRVNAEAVLDSSPFKGESEELNTVAISHNNKYFAVGGALGVLRIYQFSTGQFIQECRAHSSAILSVHFSPDDKQLISTGKDGLVAVWNIFLS